MYQNVLNQSTLFKCSLPLPQKKEENLLKKKNPINSIQLKWSIKSCYSINISKFVHDFGSLGCCDDDMAGRSIAAASISQQLDDILHKLTENHNYALAKQSVFDCVTTINC